MSITTIIFNTDKKLKSAAQKKAKRQGITLTAFLNMATRAYVENSTDVDIIARDLAEARQQIAEGKFTPAEEVYKRLGIKK